MPTKKVLIAVLHWGLGHATRCIPIINALEQAQAEVHIASDGGALHLLQKEFPSLHFHELPSYNISYAHDNMFLNILGQSKNIFNVIKKEKKAISTIVASENISIIISDNRFGCYHEKTHNIFITHQVNIQTFNILGDFFAKKINHYWIKKFDELWIPDHEDYSISLAADLSHGNFKHLPFCQYLGIISRFEQIKTHSTNTILIVLSGPEPQRTRLEAKIMAQIPNLPYTFCLVRGIIKDNDTLVPSSPNLTIMNYATSAKLNELIQSAQLVIARSGYTTLLDLAILHKKALLIPTPGQSEQYYLAQQLSEKNICHMTTQSDLDLEKNISKALKMKGFQGNYEKNIENIVKNLFFI
jgi:uncharacterized protein (TIGR00661 family)